MNEKLIRDYIREFQEKRFENIIKRELSTPIIEGKCVSIIGPRRAGKTYFFFSLISNLERRKSLYLDFEEIFLKNLNAEEILEIILKIFPSIAGNEPTYVFLDEIQNIKGWESLIRTLLNRGYKIFVTGSSSKLLSKEIATQLRGRTLSYLLLPFSFIEYLRAKNERIDLNKLSNAGKLMLLLEEYIRYGGFPEVVLKEEKERMLKEYLNLAFYKDFMERHEIKSMSLASLLFNHIIQNYSNEFSVRSIAKRIKTQGVKYDINTFYRYLEFVEDTLFIFFLRRFSLRVHLRESWPKKVYLCDTGLTKVIQFSDDIGKLIENTVFLELLRRTNENPLMEIYYFKTREGHEIDFLTKEGNRISRLIQVTYANGFDEIDPREIRALLHAKELFKKDKPELMCITWDYEGEKEISWFGKEGTIKFIPLWKWLIEGFRMQTSIPE